MRFSVLNRKVHYWLSVFVALPLAVMIVTGILLQLKKQLPFVQPPERRGGATVPVISFDDVLRITASVPEARVKTWDDINRLDVRPSRGMLKVWAKSNYEIQIDTATGQVLQVAYRRSDLIEALHDGSWFSDPVKYGLFLTTGIALFVLWLTGLYLFIRPYWTAWRRRRAR